MEISKTLLLVVSLVAATCFLQARAAGVYCSNPYSKCYRKYIECPEECPSTTAMNSKYKVCYADCDKRPCTSQCRMRKPNCNRPGSACYDPRFIGGDGIVFYFHGKSNEEFSLVSDSDLQINGRFIGHRPAGRARDFTWIQALGFLFNSHKFSLEAAKTATWDNEVDHLKFTFDGQDLSVPEETLSTWLNPAKPGVAMPVVGGEDSFKTSSLLSNDCKTCIFSESQTEIESVKSEIEYAALDCTRGASSGYGIVCRK
ncbi:hypothetical protein YC2023_022223 [Brassica napus]